MLINYAALKIKCRIKPSTPAKFLYKNWQFFNNKKTLKCETNKSMTTKSFTARMNNLKLCFVTN